MNSNSTKCLALVSITILLSACASERSMPAPPTAWSQITPQRVVIKGEASPAPIDGNDALANQANLRMALDAYGDFSDAPNLGQLIKAIKDANRNPNARAPGMTGLGGVLGHAFLDAADRAINTKNPFDTTQQVLLSVSGQITQYEFTENGSTGQGNGSLEVITYVTSIKVPLGNGAVVPKTTTYRWKIRVINNGFSIVPKGTDPNNPFPGTLEFTPEMIARINVLGYMYKLWAKGTDIKIDEVARKAGSSSNFIVLPKSNPEFAKLYAEIDENCIDMLFVDRPPASLDGLGPPLYCLGRCKSPLIVNTGV